MYAWRTVEEGEIERVDVEAGVVVVLEDVARRVDVGAGVRREPELGEVGDVGAVAHGARQPQEPGRALRRLERRHVLPVVVADVQDRSPSVSELRCPHRRWLSVWHGASCGFARPLRYGLDRSSSTVKSESLARRDEMI